MRSFVDVRHDVWIDAPRDLVRDQFGDLDHHIRNGVHPGVRLRRLAPDAHGRQRFEQEVRLFGLLRQRDVFERRHLRDGTIVDTSLEGSNRGGTITASFERVAREGRLGTLVMLDLRVPLPRLVSALARPLVARAVRRELERALAEDKADLEAGRYAGPARARLRAA